MFDEIARQFHAAFEKIKTSGIGNPDEISEIESKVGHYIELCKDHNSPAILVQSELHKIIRTLRNFDGLSNHGYLSLAHAEFVLLQKQNKQPHHMTAEMRSHAGLADHIRGKHAIKESSEETEKEWESELDHLENHSDSMKKEIEDIDDIEDIHHLYDEDDFVLKEEAEQLDEHMSRKERIRRKIQMNKSKTKMERKREMALKRVSSTANLTRKARRLAIEMIKEKIARKKLSEMSVAEKEKLEDMVMRRKELINRMAAKLAPKIKKIEQERVLRAHSMKEHIEKLNEVMLVGTDSAEKFGYENALKMPFSKLSTQGDGNKISPKSNFSLGKIGDLNLHFIEDDENDGSGHVISHTNDNVHHIIRLTKVPNMAMDVVRTKTASSNSSHPVKMHQIYKHLIDHGMTLMSDTTQTHGGLKIWKDLAKMPDVSVHGWHMKKDIPINTDEFLEDESDTHTSVTDDSDDYFARAPIVLIAHKKEGSINEVYLISTRNSRPNDHMEDDIFYGSNTIHDARDYLGSFSEEKNLGKLGDHLHVSAFEDKHSSKGAGRILTHDANGVVHHVIAYNRPYNESKNTMVIKTITRNRDAHKTVDAHEVYHHLLNQGNILQSDDTHSLGGLHVWRKLSRMSGVNVHAWDLTNDKPINSDRYLRSIADTHAGPDIKEPEDTIGESDDVIHRSNSVVLVAHK